MLDDEPLQMSVWEARRVVAWRLWALRAAYLASGGLCALVASWPFMQPQVARWTSVACSDAEADIVLVESMDGSLEVCRVESVSEVPQELRGGGARGAPLRAGNARMLLFRHTRFLLDTTIGSYRQLDPESVTGGGGAAGAVCLTPLLAAARLTQFGRNVIDVPIPPAGVLLLRECVHPFIAFQAFSIILWCTEAYYTYAVFIFVTALASAVANFWEVRKNLLDVRALSLYTTRVRVLRRVEAAGAEGAPLGKVLQAASPTAAGGAPAAALHTIDSASLVPGDVLVVEHGMRLPADCVLLAGSATVDEAMLTGESTVVVKAELPEVALAGGAAGISLLSAEQRNTLYGGSVVV